MPFSSEHTIQKNGQRLSLHPSGAVYWEERDVLMLSDLHLGKSAHFRKYGMAVPSQADDAEFDKLISLLEQTMPRELWFLGDLFHSELNSEWHFFEQWVQSLEISVTLVVGNHDVISRKRYEQLDIRLASEIITSGFHFTHEPLEIASGKFNIAGHVHPAIKVQGVGRQRIKLPCFHYTENQLILPAFGSFTGTYTIRPKKSDRIFALADGEIICFQKQ